MYEMNIAVIYSCPNVLLNFENTQDCGLCTLIVVN